MLTNSQSKIWSDPLSSEGQVDVVFLGGGERPPCTRVSVCHKSGLA